jgi:hypothetical protein
MKIRFVRDCKIGDFAYKSGKEYDLTFQEVQTLQALAPDVFLLVGAGEVYRHLPRPPVDRMMHAPKVTK